MPFPGTSSPSGSGSPSPVRFSSPSPGGMAPSSGSSSLAGSTASDLAGMGDEQAGGMGDGSGQDQGVEQILGAIQQMDSQISDLATQFPGCAPAARQASSGLRAMMRQIVANPGASEPAGPTE